MRLDEKIRHGVEARRSEGKQLKVRSVGPYLCITSSGCASDDRFKTQPFMRM